MRGILLEYRVQPLCGGGVVETERDLIVDFERTIVEIRGPTVHHAPSIVITF